MVFEISLLGEELVAEVTFERLDVAMRRLPDVIPHELFALSASSTD